MIIANEVQEYLDYYEQNKSEFNKDRILLIENIIKPTLARSDVFFDEITYRKCLSYCLHNYYPLFPYQKFIYAFVFVYKEDDSPLFSTFFIEMGRGNGKDGFMMPLCNFLQTPLYNVKNYNIDIVANNEEQAHDSFDVVYDMLNDNPKFKGKFYVTKEKIINLATNSRLRYNTSNAKTKDGKKGGLILFNEYHAYETVDQINVFTSQRGKIKHPRTIIITTNGYVRGGPLDEMLYVCRDILRTGINDLGYFPFICCIDSDEEADRPECWIKANPSIEFMPILKNEIKLAYLEAKKFPSKWAEFMTKRMNRPARNEECTVASWENILKASYSDIELKTPRTIPELKNRNAVIGIDYADIRDFASAGLLFKKDGEYIWKQKTWICKNSPFFENIKFPFNKYGFEEYEDFEIIDDSSLSATTIVRWCMEQTKNYSIQKIVMDTFRFSLFREAFETQNLDIESNKNPYGIVRMIRHSNAIYTLTAPLIEKSFADKKINFGPSAIMRWYTNNTGMTIDKIGNKSFFKIEPKLRKNDGFMAFVAAMSAEQLLDEIIMEM